MEVLYPLKGLFFYLIQEKKEAVLVLDVFIEMESLKSKVYL